MTIEPNTQTGGACIFCRIAAGEAEASVVCEDAETIAFIDLRQFHAGHTLVIPKRHVEDIFALDETTAAAVAVTVVRVAKAVRAAFAPDGISIWQSNGEAAGQEVPHLHVHVLPRRTDDGMVRIYPSRPGYPARAVLDEQAAAIRADFD